LVVVRLHEGLALEEQLLGDGGRRVLRLRARLEDERCAGEGERDGEALSDFRRSDRPSGHWELSPMIRQETASRLASHCSADDEKASRSVAPRRSREAPRRRSEDRLRMPKM